MLLATSSDVKIMAERRFSEMFQAGPVPPDVFFSQRVVSEM
jgi:hypothetical protein